MLDGSADLLMCSSAMQQEASLPFHYPGMKEEKMYGLFLSTFLGEEALKAEKKQTFWNPIFNYDVDEMEHRICGSGVGRLRSQKELLIVNFVEDGNVAFTRAHAVMDVGLGWLAAALELKRC